MKRFFTLLLLFFNLALGAQNLIADWSAENYSVCPNTLGPVQNFLPNWIGFKGTADYFHSCCQLPQLCWNNSLGFQEPKTGEGYIGSLTYHTNLTNAREYFGVNLLDTLEIGSIYYIEFNVSMAFKPNASQLATNNIGFLLMCENYLDTLPLGVVPNFSHFKIDTILSDNINWLQVSTHLTADSNYKYIAFGNFYDDNNTQFSQPYTNETGGMIAYYYWDDFCVSKDSNLCNVPLSNGKSEKKEPNIYPNPCSNLFTVSAQSGIISISIYDLLGYNVFTETVNRKSIYDVVLTDSFSAGFYQIIITTEEGITKKKIMVIN